MFTPKTTLGVIRAIYRIKNNEIKLRKFLKEKDNNLKWIRNLNNRLNNLPAMQNELSKQLSELVDKDKEELKNNNKMSYERRKRLEERIEAALPFIE